MGRPEPEAPKSGHARGGTPLGAARPSLYPGARHTAADPVGSPTSGSKFGFRRASCFRYILCREKHAVPQRNWAPGRILGAPGVPKNDPEEHHRVLFFDFCRRRVVDVFMGRIGYPKGTPTRAGIMGMSGFRV